MSDILLNIHEAKTHLSRYLNCLSPDDRIILCRRNRPVAEVRLLPHSRQESAVRLGLAKGQFEVTSSFLEPLSPELLDAFGGGP
jgi:antitoxin (DNA-binding transcriptional repressor) of toxin-antitoxin stability system